MGPPVHDLAGGGKAAPGTLRYGSCGYRSRAASGSLYWAMAARYPDRAGAGSAWIQGIVFVSRPGKRIGHVFNALAANGQCGFGIIRMQSMALCTFKTRKESIFTEPIETLGSQGGMA